MFSTIITVTVTGGVLYRTGQVYAARKRAEENKKRKELPWRYYAQRLGKNKKKKLPHGKAIVQKIAFGRTVLAEKTEEVGSLIINRTQTFKKNSITLFSGQRRQQMQEITGGRYEVKSDAEKRVDRALVVAFVNMGFVGMSWFYPPFILLSIPTIIYTYIPSYEKAYNSVIKEKRITSYLIDVTFITGALFGRYFATMAADVWMSLIGLKVIYQSEYNTKKNLSHLFGEQPRSVWIVRPPQGDTKGSDEACPEVRGIEVEIPFESLQLGDTIIVSAGQMIPVDGIIKDGFASIDQHKLTGESQPIEKGVGDPVLASTIVLAGKLYIEVEKTGQETIAMQIGQILNQTAEFKDSMRSRGELIADRSIVPTAGLFLLSLPILDASRVLALITNKFGTKMRAFGPASMLTFLNLACQQGILIKDGRSLELLNEIDTIVFDKTGTLTLEQPTVGKVHTSNGSEDDILRYAAAAEHGQAHPIAKAIVTAANERDLTWPKIEDARYEIGFGIQVSLPDKLIRVGSHKFMVMEQLTIGPEMSQIQQTCDQEGHSLVYVAFDDKVVGAIELHATIRPEAKQVIDELRQRNISMYIISGDQEPPTKKLAQELGIDHYFANTLPENKAELVEKLREEGKSICFVGDGINDTIALKKANVSVSLRGATTIATDTAQVVLMDGTLNQLGELFDIAQDLNVNMKHNFLISTVPAAINLTAIFLLPHWGLFSAVLLSHATLLLGIGNSMLPLFKQQNRKSEQSKSHLSLKDN